MVTDEPFDSRSGYILQRMRKILRRLLDYFADMGDSSIELIATGSDEYMLIVHALLEVAAHPEYDIASMTFNFCYNLHTYLLERESYVSYGLETLVSLA
ncbi:hypothetical protein L1987_83095 [Smallanthus sonchifolius]|uniref:Uncharacterized protein n=1 Tax=Smallanthus sonchifolius TaxID=185202 RepID=A0ACB8YC54_9ASTR|nr:hypothetical protein L1987_83095 [Smallanthus sonchifolius]